MDHAFEPQSRSGGGRSVLRGRVSDAAHGPRALRLTPLLLLPLLRYCAPPSEDDPVCCATTDYAMQSVLMQMGLKLLSVDGMVLRSIKHWVRIGTRLGPRA